ncbi:hypothetical protein [Actinoallomurus sp. NPDC052274]|uniref:hypothetical protein n=1 Tax=Actinoallomurus sp. NPDC052274 TaxID=3155420 RepID=UPI0034335060
MTTMVGFSDDRLMTELPTRNQPWPPPRFDPIQWHMRTWDAWFSGDPDMLMRAYYSLGGNSPTGRSYFSTTGEAGLPSQRPGQFRGGLLGSIRRWFWGNATPPGEKRTNYHVPLAGDIAATSSALLFSKPPTLTYEGLPAVQEFLEGFIDDGTHATLLEGAELCSALGGVYLRVVWDTDISDHPWLDIVPADVAIPEFSYGRLRAVTFWRVIEDTGSTVVRHLEKHVPGQNAILHGVYVGDQKELGRSAPLTDFAETAPLAGLLTDGNAITFPDQPKDASTVVYIPNMRPNRLWRGLGPQANPLGRSDYAGVEGLMDGLDEVYTSWLRDIRLGKARLIVPHEYLDSIGRGKGAIADLEREVFTPLKFLVNEAGASQIVSNQFNIRWQEHSATAKELIERIISQSGYSASTFGLQGDVVQTATEVDSRNRKSQITRGKKINYWRPGLADITYGLLSIEATVFGRTELEPVRPLIEFPDVVMPNQLEEAQTVAALRSAEAMSIQVAVEKIHPDWKGDQVDAEVARIHAELAVDAARSTVHLSGGQDLEQGTGTPFDEKPEESNDE